MQKYHDLILYSFSCDKNINKRLVPDIKSQSAARFALVVPRRRRLYEVWKLYGDTIGVIGGRL